MHEKVIMNLHDEHAHMCTMILDTCLMNTKDQFTQPIGTDRTCSLKPKSSMVVKSNCPVPWLMVLCPPYVAGRFGGSLEPIPAKYHSIDYCRNSLGKKKNLP